MMEDKRRNEIIDIIKKEYIGPDPVDWEGFTQPNGEEILYGDSPRARYTAGVLYPAETPEDKTSDFDDEELAEPDTDDEISAPDENIESDDMQQQHFKNNREDSDLIEEVINRSNAYRQSAMSMTVAVQDNDKVFVNASAGKYTSGPGINPVNGNSVTCYRRSPVLWGNNKRELEFPDPDNRFKKFEMEDEKLEFDIAYRYRKDNCTVYTFTLQNQSNRSGSFRDEDCYFQVEFCLKSELGFCPLPVTQMQNTNDEDYLSNQLLYRDKKNYAIGHGCAAEWDDSDDRVSWIKTSVLPEYEVKPIVPSKIDGMEFEMKKYGPDGDVKKMIQELRLMCEKYGEWIDGLKVEMQTLNDEYPGTGFQDTAERHIANCEKCLFRMEEGISLLESNENVRTAFQHMNVVMLMQQLHYQLPLQRWEFDEGGKLYLKDEVQKLPDPDDSNTWFNNHGQYGKWRPFQIAFILMNLKSMLERDCEERNIVDLIWFPTGGGKTEAYLGLTAYTIFLRRILNREDSGTAVLMRYTLRLLTAQQYERAASLICACEIQRQNHEELFGKSRITIGLWVGVDTTPNQMKDAVKIYDKLYSGAREENPFVILKCPWCGAQMGVVKVKDDDPKIMGYSKTIRDGKKKFEFICSNPRCNFSEEDNPLPLLVIDDAIYEEPPALLLGTVDKFAMLPFLPKAQSLFGYDNGVKVTSPDLIIQDELHLISGPLGSMVGLYETLIHDLCISETEDGRTVSPKIIGSTATISRAREQCHDLYGCPEENVFQFPPSGLSADDSFFAHEDREQNGRKYIGILAMGQSSDDSTAIRLYAALLYAAKAINVDSEAERDPYWTNIGYFNSLRELGQACNWIHADIEQQLDVIYKRKMLNKIYGNEYTQRRRYIWRDEELTSRISGDKVTTSLANLNIPYFGQDLGDTQPDDRPIDICNATNMISVGLDVQRLGLMTVSGQPKTTSEYIQATSRVGRDADKAPGLVFVLYRPGRPRDRSHYEHFKEYHSRLYCNVEPTSVTPFSSQARERALHAVMIGLMRLESDSDYNESKPRIPDDEVLSHVEQVIRNRVSCVDPREVDDTIKMFWRRMEEWKNWDPELWSPNYIYIHENNQIKGFTNEVPLMYGAGNHPNKAWSDHGFKTPQSMRSVDSECLVALLGRYLTKETD